MKELLGQVADHGYHHYTGAREPGGKQGLPSTAENMRARESVTTREQELLDYLKAQGESSCRVIRKALHMSSAELNGAAHRMTRVEGVGLYEDNLDGVEYMGVL